MVISDGDSTIDMSGNGINGNGFEWNQIDLDFDETKKPKKVDLIESLLKPEEIIPDDHERIEVSDFIDVRMKDIKIKMDQIEKEISLRFQMKNRFDEEIEYQISRAAFSLSQFKLWGLGYNTGVDVKRNMLEKQLVEFRKDKRRTQLQCWEDIIGLRKELRSLTDEYRILARRKRAMT
jgi:hypothetical protein